MVVKVFMLFDGRRNITISTLNTNDSELLPKFSNDGLGCKNLIL